MAHAAERGLVWTMRWLGVMSGVVCQIRIVGSVQFPPITRIKSLRTLTKAVFGLKSTAGWGEHKVVLDESGFRAYSFGKSLGLNFLFVR